MNGCDDDHARRFDARYLLEDLDESGVLLRIENGVLKWRAPKGNMTLVLIRAVKRLDPELKALLYLRSDPRTEPAG